jgi:hypothetical protein
MPRKQDPELCHKDYIDHQMGRNYKLFNNANNNMFFQEVITETTTTRRSSYRGRLSSRYCIKIVWQNLQLLIYGSQSVQISIIYQNQQRTAPSYPKPGIVWNTVVCTVLVKLEIPTKKEKSLQEGES